jgi:hypothetical protein
MKRTGTIRGAALACALAAAACAGGGAEGTGSQPGAPSSGAAPERTAPAAVESFPPETQAFMKSALHQFSVGDPAWDQSRAEWLAKGPREASFLVETMWAALLRFQGLNQPAEVQRARHELAMIGEPSVPLLAAFLAGGTAYTAVDPKTGETHDVLVDDLARKEASEVLALVGAPAVPAVRDALEHASTKAGKRYALQTLGYIGERGGAAAYEPVLAHVRDEDEVLRVEAVLALRYFHDDATRAALVGALADESDLIRRKAAESLKVRKDFAAAPQIRAAAQSARAAARLAEADELDRAAAWLEQHAK